MTYELYMHTAYTENHAKGDKTVDMISLINRFFNWVMKPAQTPGKRWAVKKGLEEIYQEGYEAGFKGEHPRCLSNRFTCGTDEYMAYFYGERDGQFDVDRQW